MKSKIFKISIILAIIITMTMSNFILVGNGLISYAMDEITTNHQNVEFKAYFKDGEGKEVTTLEKALNEEETFLYLRINVKKEGYFNGEISLGNSNFTLKQTDSAYVNKIENNTIYLNQINVGSTEEIKVKIETIKEENFSIGLLNMTSEINIKGIYRDSKQKDINIEATRNLKLELVENNTADNVLNEMQVITNKIVKIDGQEKRMVQFSYKMGLKENNYPMKEITSKIVVPTIDGKQAEISEVDYLNNMKSLDYKYDENNIELTLKNDTSDEGTVMWKSEGNENVIITCIYDKDVQIGNVPISVQEKITLYNDKEIEAQNEITIGEEELDTVIEVQAKNSEEIIYKGKIYSGIERQYQSTTQLKINFAKAVQNIELTEANSQYIVNNETQEANVIYNQTTVKKEQFDKIFGENGFITIYNTNGEILGTIDSATPADEQGNITINYEGKEVKTIRLTASAPVQAGTLELNHIKTIKESGEIVKEASELKNKITAKYNTTEAEKEVETSIKLENTITKATLEVNKESLSTVIANNVEIKATLVSNNEKYDLYKNPEIAIQLPEQVENITINSIDLLYENELSIKDYAVDGRIIHIKLEGEQTQYKENVVEGATIVINTTINVNRKSATSDETIQMAYKNEKAISYENGEIGLDAKEIKVAAPKDITTIHSIKELGVETIGQEETQQIMLQKGEEEKQLEAQLEIINNNQEAVENVKILGDFPTDHDDNNMGIEITSGITTQGAENVTVYYSENSEATDEIDNTQNGWTQDITDTSKVSKYLIVADKLDAQSSMQGTYQYKVPSNLEYNKVATLEYTVKNTNSTTQVESELQATDLEMQTGVGPKIETRLTATVCGKEISNPVKNGEVIKYKLEVSNVGTEDITNITVKGDVPEGTTMVEPAENYEYTGAYYYQEVESENYEATIESLKVGEVVSKEYEVRVNKDTAEGTTLNTTTEVQYGEAKREDEINNITTTTGNLMVSVKRVTDNSVDLYTDSSVKYYAIIENISDKKQENVKVQTNIPENLEVEDLELITGMGKYKVDLKYDEETQETYIDTEETISPGAETPESEVMEYSNEINIGALEPGETKVLSYKMLINKTEEQTKQVYFSVVAKDEAKKEYKSNYWQDNVEDFTIGISMTANTQSQYLKSGDTVEYTIKVENQSNSATKGLRITDAIPSQLSINQVTKNGEAIEVVENNEIDIPLEIEANGTAIITIEAIVDYSAARDESEAITNVAYAEISEERVAATSEINHIIKANENEDGNEQTPGENGGSDVAEGDKTITGIVWFDENENGQKDTGEKLLSNIKVKLLNTQTNQFVKQADGSVLEATTNENGVYILDKIVSGQYIVIFEYDEGTYGLTKYKASDVSEEENSDVIVNELQIENEKKKVTSTDIIQLQNDNISGINMGLIQLKNFDLMLNKYVKKILIQNANGTTVREYNNETMAKVEMDAKQVNGSTVIIEYEIDVTNNGEVEGYAKKIADYAPTDLKFSSELNKDWYQVGNTLYTTSLANEEIKAGETKTVTLTLTKSMTEDNTGLVANTAEITEDYNDLGIADSNSTPGNRANGENDLGTAEVLLSIRTGGVIYITIAIIIVLALGITAIIIIKKRTNKERGE